jgi:hypothetical protein
MAAVFVLLTENLRSVEYREQAVYVYPFVDNSTIPPAFLAI